MAKDTTKPKKKNFFAGTLSELKQVSWPSFKTTLKRLGAVLVITGFFLVVLIGIDSLLSFIYNELFSIVANPDGLLTGSQITALAVAISLVIVAIACVVFYKVRKSIKNKSKKDEGFRI